LSDWKKLKSGDNPAVLDKGVSRLTLTLPLLIDASVLRVRGGNTLLLVNPAEAGGRSNVGSGRN
jgi:hypothetical protein